MEKAFCASCGASFESSTSQRTPTGACSSCQDKRAAAAAMELQQNTIANLQQKEADDTQLVQEKLQEMGLDPADYRIAVLPAFDRHLEKGNARRRNAFTERLAEIIAEFKAAPHEAPTSPSNIESPPANTALSARGCAACGGYCCKSGGDRAYLTRQTITRVLASSPDMTPEDVFRAYLDRLPAESYAKSCIFHTKNGCNLPFDMRSDTCNAFYCTDVRRLAASQSEGEKRPVLAAALKNDKVVRLVVVNDDEGKYLFGKEP